MVAFAEPLPAASVPLLGETLWRLLKVWFSWDFVYNRRAHFVPLAFGVLFWWRVIAGVFAGVPPLLGWMSSAYLSVWLTTIMVMRVFRRAKGAAAYSPAMLLLMFITIILFNSFVLGLMVWLGMYFRVADAYILGVVTASLSAVIIWMFITEASALSDWALCGYSLSLKSAPQVVQAVWLAKGTAKLDPWSAVFLFFQGLSRLVLSFGMWRQVRSRTALSQLVNATGDQLTITPIFVIVLWQSWEQLVVPLIPSADFIITMAEGLF